MKISIFAFGALTVLGLTAQGSTLIFSDNFDGLDAPNFDAADPTGTARRAGTAATDIRLRSARRQHTIVGNEVDLARPGNGSGRLRFHEDGALGNWFDWSAGTVGTQITTAGGFRVEFDWTPADNTATDWVSWNVGFSQSAEPAVRVNNVENDFGILFRNNGGTQHFHNNTDVTTAGPFTETLASRHVVIDYAFTSWADGSDVLVTASVDGTDVLGSGYTFDWNGNDAGGVSFELGTNIASGTFIDNIAISTIPEPSVALFAGLAGLGLLTRRRRF